MRSPVLLSGAEEVALGSAARAAAAPLLRSLAAGDSATGTLRFTTPGAVAQRLSAAPRARLRVAKRTVVLKLKTDADFAPG